MLFGSYYWKGLVDWMKNMVVREGNISIDDLMIYKIVDTPEDVVRIIRNFYSNNKNIKSTNSV